MVDIDQIEEEELTEGEVLERFTAEPQQDVEWLPEWDDHPEEQPGENTRIEDGTLIWERDGFEARLESYETTHWRAELTIPEKVGEHYPRPVDLKCHPLPEHGFVESVEQDGYTTSGAVIVIAENFQPVYEVNRFIDELIESAEESKQFMEALETGLEVAKEATE